MLHKTACPHCAGHIEFASEHNGRTSSCPHCQGEIILTSPETEAAAAEMVAAQTADGKPKAPPASWNVLARVFHNFEQKQLEQTRQTGQRSQRIAATLAQVRNGTWQVEAKNIVMSTGERALWRQAAALVDPAIIGRKEQGGALGVTTKIFKSITTRLTRPPSEVSNSSPTTAPVLQGELIVTNYRLVFSSRAKTFITRFENLVDVTSTLEGVKFSEKGKPVVYAIKYDQPNGDIIAELIQFGMEPRL